MAFRHVIRPDHRDRPQQAAPRPGPRQRCVRPRCQGGIGAYGRLCLHAGKDSEAAPRSPRIRNDDNNSLLVARFKRRRSVVGATLVVARFAHRVRQQGDHKGRPYIKHSLPGGSQKSPFPRAHGWRRTGSRAQNRHSCPWTAVLIHCVGRFWRSEQSGAPALRRMAECT